MYKYIKNLFSYILYNEELGLGNVNKYIKDNASEFINECQIA